MGWGLTLLGVLAVAAVVGLRLLALSAGGGDGLEIAFELGLIGLVVYFALAAYAEARRKRRGRDDDFIVE
ncbi:hypothetical protein [Crenobacter luteus]|uniref:Uncharacterized protein n=1 Tax=Crenobacter luteus TaxID=1452487 RepID=A0A163CFW3_9NEIS|nr:hypothetical protein [Crenobacter luteus]KZE31776.1 hypothetical protein AVW16_00900 [Crenobacter luteus]